MVKTILYGHFLRGSVRVKPGQIIKQNDEIAIIGNTGYSLGPHLHITMAKGIHTKHWYGSQTAQLGGTKEELEAFVNRAPLLKNKLGLRKHGVEVGWVGNHQAIDLVGVDFTSKAGESIIVWNQEEPGKVIAVLDYGDGNYGRTGVTVLVQFGNVVSNGAHTFTDSFYEHVLQSGETLWDITKGDQNWINQIIADNKIDDVRKIPSNTKLKIRKSNNVSNIVIAREVIRGLWGNGVDRAQRLEKAGYDYKTIQNLVNELI